MTGSDPTTTLVVAALLPLAEPLAAALLEGLLDALLAVLLFALLLAVLLLELLQAATTTVNAVRLTAATEARRTQLKLMLLLYTYG